MILCTGDHEYSIFDSVEDHAGYSPRRSDCELHHAELVVSLDGWRGHYLGRDFTYEAMALLEDDPEDFHDDVVILDRYENESDFELEPGYTIGEAVSDITIKYENKLFEAGFYVEWNDGVQVVKIGDEINDET